MREYLIALNSKDAYLVQGQTHSFLLREPLICQGDEELFAHIHHASIPNAFYNIQSGENAFTISETVGGVSTNRLITITPANYTAASLRTELANQLNTVNTSYTVTFNSEQGKYTIASLSSQAFALSFDSNSPRRSLGFGIGTATSVNNKLTSDRVADLTNGRHLIHIHTSLATTSVYSSRLNRVDTSLLGIIPIDVPNFSVIQYQIDQRHMCHLSERYISNFDVVLKDSEGATLDFNGVGWELTLKVMFMPRKSPIQPIKRLVQLEREMLSLQQQRVLEEQEKTKTKKEREAEAARQIALQAMFSEANLSSAAPARASFEA